MTKDYEPSILLAIPTYNCERQITRVLDEIDDELLKEIKEIAVIDNGSKDRTIDKTLIYKKMGRLGNKLHVYKNDDNYSLGGTHKVAFLHAEKTNCSHVIILHGDNQAKSDEAKSLINFTKENPEYSTVLGSRFNKDSTLIGYDKKRVLGNHVLNVIYSALTLKKCEDLGSGLNMFALSDLNKSDYLQFADKMTFNIELLLNFIKRKVNFSYLPITWREDDQVSNAHNFNIFKTAIVNLINWRLNIKKNKSIKTDKDYSFKEIF
jgi:glycosyltransferase involved in cell wall biosynthesis